MVMAEFTSSPASYRTRIQIVLTVATRSKVRAQESAESGEDLILPSLPIELWLYVVLPCLRRDRQCCSTDAGRNANTVHGRQPCAACPTPDAMDAMSVMRLLDLATLPIEWH